MTTPTHANDTDQSFADLYPWRAWASVRSQVDKMWDPSNTPHHSIIGLTGSGKSYLTVNGILSMCNYGRVLIVDKKGDDPVLNGCGAKPVSELPQQTWYQSLARNPKRRRREHWYRLVVDQNAEQARPQVYKALHRVYDIDKGGWVLVLDEIKRLSDPRRPNLNLSSKIEELYQMGRGRELAIISGTQSPVWVPNYFYDQASFGWIGCIRDERRQKRLVEIGGMERKALPLISALERRQWFLSADNGDYFARTEVKI